MKYLKEMHYMDERYTNFLKDTLMQIGKSCSDLFKDRIKRFAIVILFRMGFFGAADGWEGGEGGGSNLMKPGTVMPYLKKIQKIYEPPDTPL